MTINTETPAGRAWLDKYLHPPGVQKSAYAGTPDNNMSPITTLNFDTIDNISTSVKYKDKVYNVSDMFFLQTTGARVVAYIFVRHPAMATGDWILHPQTPAIVNDSYDFVSNWGSDVSLSRMAYKSCTYYLNATAFNDQGTVTIAQTRPSCFVFQTAHLPSDSDTAVPPESFTSIPVRRDLSDYDYNAQILDIGDVSGAGYSGAFVPSTATQVQQSNPRAVTHMAKLGAFVPQHWSQPTNRFYATPDQGNGSKFDLVQNFIRFITEDGSEHTLRLYSKMGPDGDSPVTPTLHNCADTNWSDFTISYVYFSGLSAVDNLLVSNAYITVKSMYGIEVQPHVKSSFVFFQNNPPIPDDRAIHMAAAIIHQVPDGYPSSANDFGSILSLVTSFAPKVINWLSNAFSANAKPAAAATKEIKREVKREVSKDVAKAVVKPAKTPPRPAFRVPTPAQRIASRRSALDSFRALTLNSPVRRIRTPAVRRFPPLRIRRPRQFLNSGSVFTNSAMPSPMQQITNNHSNPPSTLPPRRVRFSNRL